MDTDVAASLITNKLSYKGYPEHLVQVIKLRTGVIEHECEIEEQTVDHQP